MGGPRIDVNKVRKVISSQPRTFEYTDIAREAHISTASALKIVKDMVAEGAVIVDHKVGKRNIFAISANGSANGDIKPSVIQLTPEERFEYVGDVVDMVAHGITPSALITGVSGIGKTFIVKKRLKAHGLEEGMDYKFITAHATPLGLYRLLYENRHKTLVFDDCDSVFNKEEGINVLKAALDSYEVRKVCWNSTKLPDDLEPEFEFEGQIIFVSNRTADKIDEAVKSRTMTIDLQMSRQEICEYIGTILDKIDAVKLPLFEKELVLGELKKIADGFEQFNIRTFIKACRIYQGCQISGKDWKKSLSVII